MSPSQVSTAAIALSTIAAVTGLLALKYPDRALFDEHRDIPYPKGVPIFGNILDIHKNKNRYFEYVVDIYEQLDTLTFRSSSLTLPKNVSTADPRNVEHILKHNFENYGKGGYYHVVFNDLLGGGIFNVDGDSWRIQRKTAAQIFHIKNFQTEFTRAFVDHLNVMTEQVFDKVADGHTEIDFHDVMLRYTMDAFVDIAFGAKVNSLLKNVEFAESFDAIQVYNFRNLILPLNIPFTKIKDSLNFWGKEKTIAQNLSVINNFAGDIIKKRISETKDRQITDDDDDENITFNKKTDLLYRFMRVKNAKGELYSEKELRDTMLNFVIAGRDTSAQTLSWYFYNIMLFPEIEKKLLKEIDEHITEGIENDTVALYEATKNMTYANAVLREVLRLYPGVPGNRRQAINDDIWPDGTHIKKGEFVNFQSFCQARLEKVWGPDAKEFKPERWLSPDGKLINVEQSKWFAFHLGPRLCLGQKMATLEVLIVMSMLLKKYKFSRVPGHEVVILNQITLSMKDGMKVFVEKR